MEIYKITNLLNKKIYIGKSINNSPDYYGSGILIKRAIKKYGLENFFKEVIDTAETVDELNEKEKYWISKTESNNLNIGYNIAKGRDGGDLITNNPNKEHFLEYCKNRKGEKNGMFGRKHSDESLRKMSENRKGKCKGKSTWNKGLAKIDYSEDYILNINKNAIKRTGSGNPRAKKFIIISPNGTEFFVNGELDLFAKENNLYPTLRYFVDKGKVPPSSRKCTQQRLNITGWEIRSL